MCFYIYICVCACFYTYKGDQGEDNDVLKRVKELFETFDKDGSMLVDVEELTEGLIKMRILMNHRQILKFTKQMDLDGKHFASSSF